MMMSFCKQDCVVVLAPYPNNPNPVESFNIKTRLWHSGEWPGMVCSPSTLLQLCVVRDRRQAAQRFAQRGVPGVFQHV